MGWFSKDKNTDKTPAAAPKKAGELDGPTFLALVQQEFNKAGLKHRTGTAGKLQYIELSFSGNNTNVIVRVITTDDGSEFKVMTEAFGRFPPEKIPDAYVLANHLCRKFKFAKFTVDDDGDICAQWDMPDNVPADAVGRVITEVVLRLFNIVDDAYPETMKAIWS